MSCTHDCGCSPEIRDARTDEWVQIAPESARAATLTPGQPVKAPGQGGDLFLARKTPVEVVWPTGNRLLRYVDEGGYQLVAGWVGNVHPLPWGDGRIVRVLTTEDKPTQEPVLPRQIKPEDVRVGMVVERRKGEAAHRDRVHRIDGELIVGTDGAWLWVPGNADGGWALWLVEDAPAPVNPDADVIERMAEAMWRIEEKPPTDYAGAVDDPEGWQELAHAALSALRETHDVTPRAEQ